MSTIAVINWQRFQHYKDRDPPWIKLYRDMLTTESWVLGTDLSRLLQLAITLLAARYQNATPLNFGLIKKVCSLDCTEGQFKKALSHLESTNFLEIQSLPIATEVVAQLASNTLAKCSSDARLQEAEQRQSRAEQSRARGRATVETPSLHESLPEAEWAEWLTHRRTKRWPCDELTLRKQLELLAQYPTEQQRDMINTAIRAGWQGVFPPKGLNGIASTPKRIPKTVAELEAEEAARAQH